ncbi:unnamed protein product (macronuclear) [Paramecium tetraurelia]|uniref:Uncharacterized protein n=1 Tax=Paramecium tetraurelia TaxID=5888 RepID=A0C6P7_PARTE|nr:uncharacterized protein GSPATT00035593001 [Paramecium tetraurelia]CAK66464.1 unnamed protein product [Paramecium tetraurelia]|eukprot:XP_001433861.1 hypothetical protein (macronuclear) [Paramecium tetraurelia strain d4-2]
MSFRQLAIQIVDNLFNFIQKSQNERIITSLTGVQAQLKSKLIELDQEEDDIQIKEVFLQKLQKLLQFAQTPGNLKQVWKLVSFKIYSSQDQFMELIRQIPEMIQQHTQQNCLTISSMIGQEFTELYAHSLITFQINLQLDESKFKENSEKEDCVGCITYVSPEIQNLRLYKVVMKLKGLINKVKKFDELINNGNLESELLQFTFDYNNKRITLWSQDDQISYQVTAKLTLDEPPIFEQRIYLQTDMVIQVTKNFQLLIKAYQHDNKQKQLVYNQHFTPQSLGDKQVQIKPIIQTFNTKWISINNGFEDVIYYTNEIPLKLSQYQTLPKGFEVLLQQDSFGYYVTVVGDCSAYYPRIKSKRSKGQLLQLITCQENFNLGIVYQDNLRILLNSNLLPLWNGTEIFDL